MATFSLEDLNVTALLVAVTGATSQNSRHVPPTLQVTLLAGKDTFVTS